MSEVISILPPEFLSSDLNVDLYVTTPIKPREDSKIIDSGVHMIKNIYTFCRELQK